MPDPYTSSSPPAPSVDTTRRRRRRRRHLLLSPFSAARTSPSVMTSSSASSPASGLSLFSFSRSPSPFHHRFLSPLHASSVPFAWERRPGVPKTPVRQSRAGARRAAKSSPPLPLPPYLLSGSKVGADDPFTTTDDDDCLVAPEGAMERQRRRVRRQPALAAATLADWLAVLSLCQSCTTMSRDCLAARTPPQRARAMAKASWSG